VRNREATAAREADEAGVLPPQLGDSLMIRKLLALVKRKPRWRYRSSITGRIVSKAYAEACPDITVRERV
jgi:hypothetical protein